MGSDQRSRFPQHFAGSIRNFARFQPSANAGEPSVEVDSMIPVAYGRVQGGQTVFLCKGCLFESQEPGLSKRSVHTVSFTCDGGGGTPPLDHIVKQIGRAHV